MNDLINEADVLEKCIQTQIDNGANISYTRCGNTIRCEYKGIAHIFESPDTYKLNDYNQDRALFYLYEKMDALMDGRQYISKLYSN